MRKKKERAAEGEREKQNSGEERKGDERGDKTCRDIFSERAWKTQATS